MIAILRIRGFSILHTRYKTPVGEVDIIAAKKGIICFIEVKARNNRNITEVITSKQQYRISRAAALFLSKKPKFTTYIQRFDLVIIYPWKLPKWTYNAWEV